jgi:hypothetical protein
MNGDNALFNEAFGPDGIQQVLLRYESSCAADERNE